MQRYYFDIADGEHDHDDEGVECANLMEARDLALKSIPAIAGDRMKKCGDSFDMTITVRDASGKSVYSATLSVIGNPLPRPH